MRRLLEAGSGAPEDDEREEEALEFVEDEIIGVRNKEDFEGDIRFM